MIHNYVLLGEIFVSGKLPRVKLLLVLFSLSDELVLFTFLLEVKLLVRTPFLLKQPVSITEGIF